MDRYPSSYARSTKARSTAQQSKVPLDPNFKVLTSQDYAYCYSQLDHCLKPTARIQHRDSTKESTRHFNTTNTIPAISKNKSKFSSNKTIKNLWNLSPKKKLLSSKSSELNLLIAENSSKLLNKKLKMNVGNKSSF